MEIANTFEDLLNEILKEVFGKDTDINDISSKDSIQITKSEFIKYLREVERWTRHKYSIEERAQHDLFGSHSSAAAEEARKRYKTNYANDCVNLMSVHDVLHRVQQAFVEGVLWKEEQLKIR